MPKNATSTLVALAGFLTVWPLGAQDGLTTTQDMHIKITSALHAGPPKQWGRFLFLTWQTPKGVNRPRYVAAVFRHDPNNLRHVFSVNAVGVFYLFHELPASLATEDSAVEYRINVDGVWLIDPHVRESVRNDQGVEFSRFPIPYPRFLVPTRSPVLLEDGSVVFSYRAPPGSTVSFVSNVNHWDPFMHPMVESVAEPGLFRIRLPLQNFRGRIDTVYYFFLQGVERHLDPLNPEIGMDKDGQQVNIFLYRPPVEDRFRRRDS